MKKMNFLWRALTCILLTIASVSSLAMPALAADEETSDVTVIEMLVVSEDGCYLYEGDEAAEVFAQMDEEDFVNSESNRIAESLADTAIDNTSSEKLLFGIGGALLILGVLVGVLCLVAHVFSRGIAGQERTAPETAVQADEPAEPGRDPEC